MVVSICPVPGLATRCSRRFFITCETILLRADVLDVVPSFSWFSESFQLADCVGAGVGFFGGVGGLPEPRSHPMRLTANKKPITAIRFSKENSVVAITSPPFTRPNYML